MMNFRHVALAAALVTAGAGAQAALVDRGGGMIYDTELNITWLQNWNQGASSGYDSAYGLAGTGLMTWDNARAWADNLVFGGFDDWRLPTMVDTGAQGCDWSYAGGTDCGTNVQTKSGGTVYSEMAHLYYETLGNLAYCPPGDVNCAAPQPGWGLTHTGPFTNMQSYAYWSGLVYAPDPGNAWGFYTDGGGQSYDYRDLALYAVAVRPGDVAASVPEPQSLALVLLAAGAALLVGKRRPV